MAPKPPLRILVCGSRYWDSQTHVDIVLNGFYSSYWPLVIIEGEAPGADKMARRFAEANAIEFEPYPADWYPNGQKERDRSAGPKRNQQMLVEGKPDVVVAFSDDLSVSKGTADMVRRAKKADLPVILISRP